MSVEAGEITALMTEAEALRASGNLDGTIARYRDWLASHPAHPFVHVAAFNLGVALGSRADPVGAEAAYRQAIAGQPGFLEAHLNLGSQLEAQGRRVEAIATWQAVLTTGLADAPDKAALLRHLLNNLGRALELERELESAEAMLARSLRLDPAQPDVIQHWVHLRQRQCRWPVQQPFADVSLAEIVRGTSPLAMLAGSAEPALQLYRAAVFVQQKVLPGLPAALQAAGPFAQPRPLPARPPAPATAGQSTAAQSTAARVEAVATSAPVRKLRIGYLSSDFCQHAVSLLTVELIERHDRDRVEVTAFSWSRDDGSAVRNRIRNAVAAYVPIGAHDDEAAAQEIRARGIDVLIDLQGLTSGARPGILARRPAPLQLTWLGFPGTTGLPGVDGVIADRFVLPEALTPYFSETPLYLPHSFQPSDSTRVVGAAPTRAEVGLPASGVVYCSFNNNYKFDAPVFARWLRILGAVPGSVLWLLADNRWAEANLRAAARAGGIDPQRLVFAARIAPEAYLARYRAADLFLDTWPFNAGATASDALWAGLPLLTCPGRTFASRMAGSLLNTLGLPELIADDPDDYERRAIAFGQDPARLRAVRERLASARETSPLFDIQSMARDLEAALIERVGLA